MVANQSQYRQYQEGTSPLVENHLFANLGAAQEGGEQEEQETFCRRNRIDTQEAHFGGSGSEKNLSDEDVAAVAQDTYALSDDDDESMQRMNESRQFLNEIDKIKNPIQQSAQDDL